MTPDQLAVIDRTPGWQIGADLFSSWVIPALVFFIIVYAYGRRVKVYEVFVEGAKEGFSTAVMIIPYLVAIFAAIALFRASGTLSWLSHGLGMIISPNVMPTEVLMMSLLKPLSGSGARALMLEVFGTYKVDSYAGFLASTIQGATETTFYVVAVYFGAVGVKRTRYTLGAALTAELIAVIVAVIGSYFYWHATK